MYAGKEVTAPYVNISSSEMGNIPNLGCDSNVNGNPCSVSPRQNQRLGTVLVIQPLADIDEEASTGQVELP